MLVASVDLQGNDGWVARALRLHAGRSCFGSRCACEQGNGRGGCSGHEKVPPALRASGGATIVGRHHSSASARALYIFVQTGSVLLANGRFARGFPKKIGRAS